MKQKMRVYYDEEGDFLEIGVGSRKPSYFEGLGKDVFARKDEKTGEIKGLAIFNFKKRTQNAKDLELNLPLKIELSS